MDIVAQELTQNVKAFLKVIQKAEGTDKYKNPYGTFFGGGQFTSYTDHPRVFHYSGAYKSSAAGAYQILKGTYDSLKMKDFYPGTQDRAAVQLLKNCGALPLIEAGRFEEAIKKASGTWASLPGSQAGQPIVKMEILKSHFIKLAGVIKKASPLIYFVCGAIFLFSVLKSKLHV